MSTAPSLPRSLVRLVDDAAIFPPGLAPLPEAVAAHRAFQRSAAADFVGPFVVDTARLPALLALVADEPDQPALAVAVVVTGAAGAVAAVRACAGTRARLAGLEVRLEPDEEPAGQVRRIADDLRAELGDDLGPVRVAVETPRPSSPSWRPVLAAVARAGLTLKFRTGGTEAAAFPDEQELAAWIVDATASGVAFKCTAGLHDGIRQSAAETGFEHHGYLNVLLATARARDGASRTDVAAVLAERDAQVVVDALTALGEPHRRADRERFLSFGSCSVDEPLADLAAHGLLDPPADPDAEPDRDAGGAPLRVLAPATSWVPGAAGSAFDVDNLPYGVVEDDAGPLVGVRVGAFLLDLRDAARTLRPAWAPLFDAASLNPLMAAGADTWRQVRAWAGDLLLDPSRREAVRLLPLETLRPRLPFEVADYVDFYASLDHASTVGRIFRPDQDPVLPNWRHLPVGYHGRAGSVVVSGTPVHRPSGQRRGVDGPVFGPSVRLDIEAELGFVVGRATAAGTSVATGDLADTVFGVVGLNDWSARDIQAWEYVPLGPNLGKSFATSIAAWVTPLAALEHARVPLPGQEPAVLEYLAVQEPAGYDVQVEVEVDGAVVSRPPYAAMYWSPAQMLAHMTVNGAALRVGDLFGSGTISGPGRDQRGSLLELGWDGRDPWRPDGREGAYLEDGDEVVLRYSAPGARGRIGLGEVRGTIVPTA